MRITAYCTHDAWYKTDRLWLAVLVAFMLVLSNVQAYRAGQKAQKKADTKALIEANREAFEQKAFANKTYARLVACKMGRTE